MFETFEHFTIELTIPLPEKRKTLHAHTLLGVLTHTKKLLLGVRQQSWNANIKHVKLNISPAHSVFPVKRLWDVESFSLGSNPLTCYIVLVPWIGINHKHCQWHWEMQTYEQVNAHTHASTY